MHGAQRAEIELPQGAQDGDRGGSGREMNPKPDAILERLNVIEPADVGDGKRRNDHGHERPRRCRIEERREDRPPGGDGDDRQPAAARRDPSVAAARVGPIDDTARLDPADEPKRGRCGGQQGHRTPASPERHGTPGTHATCLALAMQSQTSPRIASSTWAPIGSARLRAASMSVTGSGFMRS